MRTCIHICIDININIDKNIDRNLEIYVCTSMYLHVFLRMYILYACIHIHCFVCIFFYICLVRC